MKISIMQSATVTLQLIAASMIVAATGCGSSDNKSAPDAAVQVDAAVPVDAPAVSATLKLATSATLGNYLTDGSGRALYLYSKDFPAASGAAASTAVSNCSGGCLNAWPVFHADTIAPGTGLQAADFGELTRSDGSKQTTFHGWPLYYYASDTQPSDTKGEGVGNVWYVLRDPFYSMLVMASPVAGGPALYLSTADGMTLYYYMPDTVGTATTPPVSACTGGCLQAWPAFLATGTVLPSKVAAALTSFDRGGGVMQSAWKGHPLYLYATDKMPGDTKGNTVGSVWFVVNPNTLQ
jgi:predicted lipoprotein with Yx(FWY)xxD motif